MLELDPHGIEPECRSWGQDTELLIQICALGMPSRIKSGNLVEQNSLLKKPNRSSGVTAFAEELPELGNVEAQYLLAVMIESGRLGEPDYQKADELISRAAEAEYADAQANLGERYLQGRFRPQDYERAAFWLNSAAKQGSARGLFSLGAIYEYGLGVERDRGAAIDCYMKASAKGYLAAKSHLAAFLMNPEEKSSDDEALAIELMKEAAAKGHAEP